MPRLHHVEIYVGDLEASVAFWTPFMGFLGYEPERWSGGMNDVQDGCDGRCGRHAAATWEGSCRP